MSAGLKKAENTVATNRTGYASGKLAFDVTKSSPIMQMARPASELAISHLGLHLSVKTPEIGNTSALGSSRTNVRSPTVNAECEIW
jgi:hypothetical protein